MPAEAWLWSYLDDYDRNDTYIIDNKYLQFI